MRRSLRLAPLVVLLSAFPAFAQATKPAAAVETLHPALFLVGDSIMKTGTPPGNQGPWGMGYEIMPLFDDKKIHVYNEGAGGRSSRGYIQEGLWQKILDRTQPGDTILVMFGHNDAANSANYPDRTTLPGSGDETKDIPSPVDQKMETIHTYGWYMEEYAKEGKAKGATVIIMSPVTRNQWSADGKTIKRGFDGYAQWAAEAAKGSGALFLDLNAIAADKYDALGKAETAKYFFDTQHTTKLGAQANAQAVISGLRQFKDLALVSAITLPDTSTTAPATAPADRTVLFNGKDLTGWRTWVDSTTEDTAKDWKVADGVLHLDTKTKGYVQTEKSFANYHLHVEWRWAAGASAQSNSGVLVHMSGADAIWPLCFECQLASGNAGQIVGTGLDIPDAPMQQNRKRAPKLAASSEKPFGQWNTYEIYCKDNTIEVTVNGVKQNKVDKLPAKDGKIGLQMEGYPVDFQNIWLEPIK